MVKKSAVVLGILAVIALGAGMSWGYTVSQWPVPGIPGAVYCGAIAEMEYLKGPVAPSCEAPLIPGALHAVLSVPFKAIGIVATPVFMGEVRPESSPCNVELGEPAYVTAAVPCTSVNSYVPPKGW